MDENVSCDKILSQVAGQPFDEEQARQSFTDSDGTSKPHARCCVWRDGSVLIPPSLAAANKDGKVTLEEFLAYAKVSPYPLSLHDSLVADVI